jgi:hypothetical protein
MRSNTWCGTRLIATKANGFARLRMKPTLRTPNRTLGTRITVHITIIHLETLHQNLPKCGPISTDLSRRRLEDFQADTDAAFNKAQNPIGWNRTGQIISVAPVSIPRLGSVASRPQEQP